MSESTPFKQDFEANDHGSQEEADELAKQNKPRSQARLIRTSLFVSVLGNISLAVCCVFLSLLLYSERCQPCEGRTAAKSSSSLTLPGIEQETEMPIRFGWQYYAATVEEMEQVDRNWERINSDAGVVSIPHAKLAQAGVLPAQDDPSDPSKGVLSLQAYHSLHCLKIIRRTMLELAQGEQLSIRFGHAMHCLGSLLRDTVCNADASMPLAGQGDFQYLRKCRNWSAMREWVSSRTACMHTGDDGILDTKHQDFENCSRADGLLLS